MLRSIRPKHFIFGTFNEDIGALSDLHGHSQL